LGRICLSNRLNEIDQQQFRAFGELLTALIHFQSHQQYERMKSDLLAVDGHEQSVSEDSQDVRLSGSPRPESLGGDSNGSNSNGPRTNVSVLELHRQRVARLMADFAAVNFADYDEYAFYYRNKTPRKINLKKFLREKEISFENYDRMVVLLKTAATVETQTSGTATSQVDELEPEKIYLNLYKNIPHGDLELLFPNIKISMTLKDKLMLVIPAMGAAIPMALKILPSLGLLIGIIALTVFGFELGGTFKVDPESQKATYALLTAALSIGLALGGFATQQYVKYKSKRLGFLKKVADTLFFKTLDVGKGVISSLVDAAEEEQCKETLLTYFLLFTAQSPISEQALDRAAEAWLANEFDEQVDFKVAKALEEITNLTKAAKDASLITQNTEGLYQVCGLVDAQRQLDQIWDDAFPYAGR